MTPGRSHELVNKGLLISDPISWHVTLSKLLPLWVSSETCLSCLDNAQKGGAITYWRYLQPMKEAIGKETHERPIKSNYNLSRLEREKTIGEGHPGLPVSQGKFPVGID